MSKMKAFIVLLNFLFLSTLFYTQDRKALEDEKSKISSEIAYTNKLLADAKKRGSLTLDEITLLKQKIKLREKMINNINHEMRSLDRGISKNEQGISDLEDELAELKKDFSSLVELSYKTRNTQSWLMYIFASKDFSQAARRTRYLKEISKLRERQSLLIEESKKELVEKNAELEIQKKTKGKLLSAEKSEKQALNSDKNLAESKLYDIKKDEKALRKKLKEKEIRRQKLAKEIKRLIDLAMKPKSGAPVFVLTPEEKLLSGNFSKNKGKLPWPVERGVITGKFGSHPHKELDGIIVTNNGIDITTEKESIVRAVFKGEVTGIINIPGAGQAVMVKHGDYWTVYSNLAKVFVTKGEIIDTKESVGVLLVDGNISKSHIEIWKHSSSGMTKLDPQTWIAK